MRDLSLKWMNQNLKYKQDQHVDGSEYYTISRQIRFKIIEQASGLPVTVADAQDHLRVDGEESYIENLIKAAYKVVENRTQRPVVGKTVQQYFDDVMWTTVLYWGNVDNVLVQYYDEDNILQTFTDYYVDNVMDRTRIVFNSLPEIFNRPNAIVITYDCAWDVPEDVKQAILLLVGEMYEKRMDHVKRLPTAFDYLIDMYKLWHI
jgi:uncharacterized phiE125 gp8 family phage protein